MSVLHIPETSEPLIIIYYQHNTVGKDTDSFHSSEDTDEGPSEEQEWGGIDSEESDEDVQNVESVREADEIGMPISTWCSIIQYSEHYQVLVMCHHTSDICNKKTRNLKHWPNFPDN